MGAALMRYQTYAYENGRSKPAEVIEAENRSDALEANRATYGRDAGGVTALDMECSFCEDKPVANAARWIDGKAPATGPCPRCGRGGEADAGE